MSNILDPVFIFGAKYLYLLIIFIAFIWIFTRSGSERKDSLLFICICVPLAFMVSDIAGRLYYNPRPFVLGSFAPLISHSPDNGFPSHHVLLASVISAVIFIFDKRISFFLWGLTFFIGISRVYTGVHHVVDIAAGVLIPVVLVTAIYCLLAKRFLQKGK
jgi:membrane-associated phospholipid phosphatase